LRRAVLVVAVGDDRCAAGIADRHDRVPLIGVEPAAVGGGVRA
jgi:hypothetical protein